MERHVAGLPFDRRLGREVQERGRGRRRLPTNQRQARNNNRTHGGTLGVPWSRWGFWLGMSMMNVFGPYEEGGQKLVDRFNVSALSEASHTLRGKVCRATPCPRFWLTQASPHGRTQVSEGEHARRIRRTLLRDVDLRRSTHGAWGNVPTGHRSTRGAWGNAPTGHRSTHGAWGNAPTGRGPSSTSETGTICRPFVLCDGPQNMAAGMNNQRDGRT